MYFLDFLAVVCCSFEDWSCCARLPPTGTEKSKYQESGSAVERWNTVGMLKVEAERTMENVRCQAEVENKPDKLTNY